MKHLRNEERQLKEALIKLSIDNGINNLTEQQAQEFVKKHADWFSECRTETPLYNPLRCIKNVREYLI